MLSIEDNKKKRDTKKFLNFVIRNYIAIIAVVTTLQVLAIFQPLKAFYSIILFTLNVSLFLFVKDYLKEEQKKKGFFVFKSTFILFIYNLLSLSAKSLDRYSRSNKSFKPLFFLLGVGITIWVIGFFIDEKRKDFLNSIYEESILDKLKVNKASKKKKPGDAEICVDIDTEEPVIIPFEDRFLHMLVLGPTGCGKTSQVLIPLIHQDIQNDGYGITVIEPKGDLAEKIYAMAKYYNKETVYFNPTLPDCPYFNPLYGPEDEVIENMATTFKMLNPDSPQFFQDMNETLIRNALKVIKRLKGDNATLIDLSTLVYNSQGQGKIMVNQFARLKADTVEMAKENGEIASWFLSDYFNERSKTYEHCSGLRSQVAKITSNSHLRRVLNPPNGENDVNFSKIIEEGKILAISTAQGELRDLSRFLGYFIILNFQSAVFKRPGNENTRRPHFLYIDEFQVYSNPGFADMLTQGRSYRVASHLATQNRALMAMGGGQDGRNFVELVSTNARNVIIFPGGNSKDAKYYSEEFGEVTKKETMKSYSRQKFNPLYGFKPLNYPNEGIREMEITEPRFSPSDIIFGHNEGDSFGEVVYRIIANKSVQVPGRGKVSWIPWEFNKELDRMVEEYNKEQKEKMNKVENKTEKDEEDNLVDAVEAFKADKQNNKEKNKPQKTIKANKTVVKDFDYEDEVVKNNSQDERSHVVKKSESRKTKKAEKSDIIATSGNEVVDDLI